MGRRWRHPKLDDQRPTRPTTDTTDAMRDDTRAEPRETTDAPRPEPIAPQQYAVKIRCPFCRSERINSEGLRGSTRYYRCLVCVTDGDWSRFKVPVMDPLAPADDKKSDSRNANAAKEDTAA